MRRRSKPYIDDPEDRRTIKATPGIDPVVWLQQSFPAIFHKPFSGEQLTFISATMNVLRGRSDYKCSLTRGKGTTSILCGLCVLGSLEGWAVPQLMAQLPFNEQQAVRFSIHHFFKIYAGDIET